MLKIFSKLKHILIVTVILITLLFGILIFRQYNQIDGQEKDNETHYIATSRKNFDMVRKLYEDIAYTYVNESINSNQNLLEGLNIYNTNMDEGLTPDSTLLELILNTCFENAKKYEFSYLELYSNSDQLITSTSTPSSMNETNYFYTFTLYHSGNIIGKINIGLPVNIFINKVYTMTETNAFAIIKKTPEDQADNSNPIHNSIVHDSYYTDTNSMENYYRYLTDYDEVLLEEFCQSSNTSIYEPLLLGQDFSKSKKIRGNYFTLTFISMDMTPENKGYFVTFSKNPELTSLHSNLTVSLTLLIGLYVTLIFIIGFIYYILHYLYHFSYTDHLTKAYNRHKFFEVINRNIYDFQRYNYQFCVILIDIDNFKQVNDTLGHNIGDKVLIDLVKVLKDSLRTTDYLFRWGGEEFLILLPHCDVDIGYQVSEKLRKNVADKDWELASNHSVTASFGVSTYHDCKNIEMMISHADKALYHSKENGKNMTTSYPFD